MTLHVQVVMGDAVVERLRSAPETVRSRLRKEVSRIVVYLQRLVVKTKLNGQVLHRRTGILGDSIATRVEDNGSSVIGTVGTNVKYGIAWEYGFDRKVGAGARGGPRSPKWTAASWARYAAKHPAGIKTYEPRSFLRSTLAEEMPTIRESLQIAIAEGVQASLRK